LDDKDNKVGCVDCGPALSLSEGEKLLVSGNLVDVLNLDQIMEEVRRLRVEQRKRVADELLSRAKEHNQISPDQEKEYRNALMDEYDRRYLTIM
jgi:hypothetical protein